MKERIFKAIGGIPAENLYNYIKQGVVTYQELLMHGLDNYPEKKNYIESKLSAGEQSAWRDAEQVNTVDAYDMYLSLFATGTHAQEARDAIAAMEDEYWRQIQQSMSEQKLGVYERIYPNGKYIAQCAALKNDMPWFEAKKRNTKEAYTTYGANYPGQHVEEIQQAIEAIDDLNDWQHAVMLNSRPAYNEYLRLHPRGQYAAEAHERLANRSQKDIVLDNIRKDDNTYSTFELQSKVENGTLTWDDLKEVFTESQVHAIQAWSEAPVLPFCAPPKQLLSGSTEVYFWGTRATGKTCAMGAVLSSAKKEGALIAQNCEHRVYLDQLSNLFAIGGYGNICNLPPSTQKDSISELNMKFIDEKNKKHKVTFVDLAGEMVTGIYKIQNGIPLLDSEKATVDQILSYLQNPYNNKIHFFVLEYGAANKEVKELSSMGYSGVYQGDILTSIAQFLDEKGGLRKSTVGVYGLVTKSDLIDVQLGTSPADRPKLAYDYVNQSLTAFWKAINIACEKANVKDVKTIAFSIGDVFAQNLCVFDGTDSKKIVNRLLLKTKPEPEGIFGWLFK
ncbi:MAG: hypothetical protein IJ920_10220 [Paludibacteraceae bacterium]|nr:hypothetical protein [Paludibacteraceae bacterium]